MAMLDAVVIGGDVPREVNRASASAAPAPDPTRLTVDGVPATFDFLRHYFLTGRNVPAAVEKLRPAQLQLLPLGLSGPYLWQFLQARGFAVELVPTFTVNKHLLEQLLVERPRAVVLSTTFLTVDAVEDIAAFVKQRSPQTVVVAGGIKIWKSYQTKLLFDAGAVEERVRPLVARDNYLVDPGQPSAVDFLIVSERGEATLAELLRRLKAGADHRTLANLAFREGGAWRQTPVAPEACEGGQADVRVDWSRLPSHVAVRETPVSSGMGCRFRCAFCDFSGLQQVHQRPVESILAELATIPLVDGKRRVFFTDDNLFVSAKRTRELCQAVIDAQLSLSWRAFVRADSITAETAELMHRSGCAECLLGVESGDRVLLRTMKKASSPETILNAVRLFDQHGLRTQSTFIVGFPGETEATIRSTIDLLNAYPTGGPNVHCYYPFLFLATPLAPAMTPAFRKQHGLTGYWNDWAHDTMDSKTAGQALVRICDAVKPELSPIYVESRVIPWMDGARQKRVFYLRNQLNRVRRGLVEGSEAALWSELEATFAGARPG